MSATRSSDRPRVICVMGRVLDQKDGLGVYADNLLRSLFRLDPESRYVLVLRSKAYKDHFDPFRNVETVVVPAWRKLLWDQVSVPRIARRVGADLIFNPKFSIPLLTRRPGVFVLHGSDWYMNPQNYPWWDRLYIRTLLPLYARRAGHLLAISETIKNDLARLAGIDTRKVTVSYAAPSSHFQPDQPAGILADFRRRYGLPGRFMLTVVRVEHTGHSGAFDYPGGNVGSLVAAYKQYRSTGGKLPLVLVGKNVGEYVRARVRDGLPEGLIFPGFIPHEEIHLAYALADFFVLVTLYESFSLPLVEAMAMGCPAIAPVTGACPEVAGGAAVLVDPRDIRDIAKRMLELERTSELRERLRADGIARAGQFRWEYVAGQTLEAFARALD